MMSSKKAIKCPYCGSSNITPVGSGNRKAFSTKKAVGGMLLAGSKKGALAGLAGSKGKSEFFCNDCNRTFKA